MKKYHLVIATGILAVLIYPSVSFASWWNPFTWFKKKSVEQPIVQVVGAVKESQASGATKSKSTTSVKSTNEPLGVPGGIPKGLSEVEYFKYIRDHTTDPYSLESAQGWLDKNGYGKTTQTAKSCSKPEIVITEKVPGLTGDTRGYFQRVISSNPPLNNLEAIRSALIDYREAVIARSANPTPSQALVDENGERIPFSYEQLNTIDSSYSRISELQIRGYYDWIRFMDKLITDKKADGCIDGRDLYDYM